MMIFTLSFTLLFTLSAFAAAGDRSRYHATLEKKSSPPCETDVVIVGTPFWEGETESWDCQDRCRSTDDCLKWMSEGEFGDASCKLYNNEAGTKGKLPGSTYTVSGSRDCRPPCETDVVIVGTPSWEGATKSWDCQDKCRSTDGCLKWMSEGDIGDAYCKLYNSTTERKLDGSTYTVSGSRDCRPPCETNVVIVGTPSWEGATESFGNCQDKCRYTNGCLKWMSEGDIGDAKCKLYNSKTERKLDGSTYTVSGSRDCRPPCEQDVLVGGEVIDYSEPIIVVDTQLECRNKCGGKRYCVQWMWYQTYSERKYVGYCRLFSSKSGEIKQPGGGHFKGSPDCIINRPPCEQDVLIAGDVLDDSKLIIVDTQLECRNKCGGRRNCVQWMWLQSSSIPENVGRCKLYSSKSGETKKPDSGYFNGSPDCIINHIVRKAE